MNIKRCLFVLILVVNGVWCQDKQYLNSNSSDININQYEPPAPIPSSSSPSPIVPEEKDELEVRK